MHIPKTYLSLHDITGLRVTCSGHLDRALYLSIDGAHGSMEIALFLQPLLPPERIELLAKTMTTLLSGEGPKAAPDPLEHAAYEAACRSYCRDYDRNLKADLNRHWIDSELGKLQAGSPSPVDGKR